MKSGSPIRSLTDAVFIIPVRIKFLRFMIGMFVVAFGIVAILASGGGGDGDDDSGSDSSGSDESQMSAYDICIQNCMGGLTCKSFCASIYGDDGDDADYDYNDTEPPTVPTNFNVTAIASNQIQVSWDASIDYYSGLNPKYMVSSEEAGDKYAGTSTSCLYEDWIEPETEYCFQVVAADYSGNISDPTSSVCTTTPSNPHYIWKYDVESSYPMADDAGTIYAASYAGLLAINDDGTMKWTYGSGVFGPPAIGSDGTVYAKQGTNIIAVNADSTQKWSCDTQKISPAGYALKVDDGTIYVGGSYTLFAVNSDDGTIKWSYETSYTYTGVPEVGADGTVYMAPPSGDLYAIDPYDGTEKWSYETTAGGSMAVSSDTVYLVTDGGLTAINTDGTFKWSYDTDSNITALEVANDGTVYAGAGNTLLSIDVSGTLKWSYDVVEFYWNGQLLNSISALMVSDDNTVYVGDTGSVYVIDENGDFNWKYKFCENTSARIKFSPTQSVDGTIYVGTTWGLYALK